MDQDGEVVRMTSTQIQDVVDAMGQGGFSTVPLGDGIGDYRVVPVRGDTFFAIAGLPVSEVRSTIAATLTTIALVTAGGLLLLAAAIALVDPGGTRSAARRRRHRDPRRRPSPLAGRRVDHRARSRRRNGRAHRDRPGRPRSEHAAGPRRRVARRAPAQRGADAALRRRRQPRAAHPAGVDPRILRAVAARQPRSSDTTESSLERIQAQSIRMTALVEDLLLLARLDEGQELVYGTVDLSRLAIEAIADATPAGPDHGWELDLDEEPVVITGDAARLHQVVGNLLANARTHTPAGTNVTLTVVRDGTDAVLRVHDDGPGIDPAIADELFERFSRADRSRARKTGGTGLGLSIAQAIVTAHGGSISRREHPGIHDVRGAAAARSARRRRCAAE